MLTKICFTLTVSLSSVCVSAQITPETINQLHSANWQQRAKAYKALTEDKQVPADGNDALVALLQLEDSPDSWPKEDPGAPEAYRDNPSDYFTYVASLTQTVMQIADAEPQRSDVWKALFDNHYNAEVVARKWFSTHADKTATYFLAAAKGNVSGLPEHNRAEAVTVVAEIVRYERDPSTQHHLTSADVQLLDRAIRGQIDDTHVLVRMAAIEALGTVGTADDLALLDRIASTDPYYSTEARDYVYRVAARAGAFSLRKRLAIK